MEKVYIGLGTNLGNKIENLKQAIKLIQNSPDIDNLKLSSIYKSEPLGFRSENEFLNMAIQCRVNCSPEKLLEYLKKVEIVMGRKEKTSSKKFKDRIIDLDILIFSKIIVNKKNLVIPHPEMIKRAFVMAPVLELDKNISMPGTNKKLKDFLTIELKSTQHLTIFSPPFEKI